jgi:hypothetical protein
MCFQKRALCVAMVVATVILAGTGRAQAQFAVDRQPARGANRWPVAPAGQLGGGDVVGSAVFSARGHPATMTAAEWQQLVSRQTMPVLSTAEWQRLVAAQAGLPSGSMLSPVQQRRFNARAARQLQQEAMETLAREMAQRQAAQQPPADKDK